MITITLEKSVYLDKLKSVIDDKNCDAIAKAILANLSPHGLSLLYNTLEGYVPKSKFVVGQKVNVNVKTLCSWRFKSEKQTDLVQGVFKICVITDVDPYNPSPITVETLMCNDSGELEPHFTAVQEKDIVIEDYG